MITTPLKLWTAVLAAVLLIAGLVLTAPKGVHSTDAVAGTKTANTPAPMRAPVTEDVKDMPEDVFGPNFWSPVIDDGSI